jgi:hypothetical protein
MAIAITMAGLFVLSFSLALGRPTPHNVPAGLVGNGSRLAALVAALQRETDHGLAFEPYASLASAERAIDEQQIYATLSVSGSRAELLVASAAGSSVARLFEKAAVSVSEGPAGPLKVLDLHPLPPSDPNGLIAFYVMLGATILGFVTMFQLRANASALPLRLWVAAIAALAILGSLLLALISDPIIGALKGAFFALWVALGAQIAVAALFNATMLTLIRHWAMIPTWLFFVAFGNAASGGAVAPPLLPPFYAFIGRFLPNGATVETIRNAVYFHHAQHAQPIIVEAVWLVCCALGLAVATRLRHRTPGA